MTRRLPIRVLGSADETGPMVLTAAPDFAVSGPLVSCLMVSRGRIVPAGLAIACWQRQRYPNRELVIVSAATDGALAAHVAGLAGRAIRYVAAAPAPLGVLRNIAVAHAAGEIVCTWDDDDLSAPDRLDLMVATMGASKAMACFLERITLWEPGGRLAVAAARPWEPTMLVRREALPIYPAIDRGEDTAAGRMIARNHPIALLDAPDTYVYVSHGGNACAPPHFDRLFATADLVAIDERATRLRELGRTMPLATYAAELSARA